MLLIVSSECGSIATASSTTLPRNARVVGKRIAVGAEQRLARLLLGYKLLCANVARFKINLTVSEAKCGNHAVAVEENIGSQARVPMRVWGDAKDRAVRGVSFGRKLQRMIASQSLLSGALDEVSAGQRQSLVASLRHPTAYLEKTVDIEGLSPESELIKANATAR
jgi:hypothetical protein